MTEASFCRTGTTIGFWLGFPHRLNIRREGIARFTLSLAEHLLKNCPVCLEFWCYRVNEPAFRALLAPLLDAPAYAGRVGLFTESAYGSLLKSGPKGPLRDPYAGRYAVPRLEEVVNRLSGADCFLIPIVTLANALYINKPKLVALHDLAPLVYSDLFSSDHPMYEGAERLATERLVRGFIRQNAFFSSNCDYIRREHLLRLFPEVDEKDTSYVHLPVVLPQNIESQWDRHENRPRFRYTAGQQSDAEHFGVSFPLSFERRTSARRSPSLFPSSFRDQAVGSGDDGPARDFRTQDSLSLRRRL